jgi:S-formylglutathione hydrolase FrmB
MNCWNPNFRIQVGIDYIYNVYNSTMRNLTLTFLLFILTGLNISEAATVDTISTYSPSMKKNIKAVIIKPDNPKGGTLFPVVYLLHGHGGNYGDWIRQVPDLKVYAEQYQMMIVCPDGNISSWYFDSAETANSKYETYVGKELVSWIDKNYPTQKDRRGRGITGLSMGGHGALFLAFKHQDEFGVAGSMSGGVDLRPFPLNWNIAGHLGKYAEHSERWDNNSVINLTHLLTPGSLKLIIDCGTEDFFYGVNYAFHQKLVDRNIQHDFISRPGSHNWDYWKNAVQYQLLFMSNYFKNGKSTNLSN